MQRLGVARPEGRPFRLLVLGAHSDDIEIGCGGTVLRWAELIAPLEVDWLVLSGSEERAREASTSAAAFLKGTEARVTLREFREGFFPHQGSALKEFFESLKGEVDPDLILTHYRGDLHQDHRTIAELTWQTFRDHLVLEYEVPKYDGDLGSPNLFVELSAAQGRRKVELLQESFPSQSAKHWFNEETFWAMLRLRGMESRSATGYAEAFYARKLLV